MAVAGEQLEWKFQKFLPERLFGYHVSSLSEETEIRLNRRNAIYALIFELGFSACCLPLAALRRGLSLFSAVLNVVFIFFTLGGLLGTLKLNLWLTAFHAVGVLALAGLLLLYLALALAFTSGGGSTQTYLIVILVLIALVESSCAVFTTRLAYSIYKLSTVPFQDAEGGINDVQPLEGDQRSALAATRNQVAPADGKEHNTMNGEENYDNVATLSGPDLSQNESDRAIAEALQLQQTDQPEFTSSSRRNECKICMEANINSVLVPCGHMVSCTSCSKKLRKCPICRKTISRSQQVFQS
mmetsp:Transcript_12232/g.20235  ORF Transcript_12232/g.20235 Transcript_12232/m.20235 type:complete len:299 (+) Transcript_12232:182-1078(+)